MSTIEDIHRPTSCQWQCHRNRGNIGIPNTRPINLLPEYSCFNKEWGQGRVSNSCSISGTLRCNLVTNPVISHE